MYELTTEEKEYILVQLQHSAEWLDWQHSIYPTDKNIEVELISVQAQIVNLKNSIS